MDYDFGYYEVEMIACWGEYNKCKVFKMYNYNFKFYNYEVCEKLNIYKLI